MADRLAVAKATRAMGAVRSPASIFSSPGGVTSEITDPKHKRPNKKKLRRKYTGENISYVII